MGNRQLRLGRKSALATAMLALTVAGLSVLGIALRARAFELAAGSGSELLRYADLRGLEGETTLQLNGASLQLTVASTQQDVTHVLDRFAVHCHQRSGQLASTIGGELDRLQRSAGDRSWLEPIVRFEDAHSGWLGCLDLGDGAVDARQLLERSRRFIGEADVSELGGLRVLWAQRSETITRSVLIWSNGPLPLRRMFPKQGDAPGTDIPTLPRPTASRRVLSAWAANQAPLIVSYETKRPLAIALDDYAAQLRAAGHDVRMLALDDGGVPALWVMGPITAAAVTATGAGDARSLLTLVPLR